MGSNWAITPLKQLKTFVVWKVKTLLITIQLSDSSRNFDWAAKKPQWSSKGEVGLKHIFQGCVPNKWDKSSKFHWENIK